MPAIRHLPEGWQETRRVVLTDDRLLARLNLLALIPLGLSAILMFAWSVLVYGLRGGIPPGPDIPWGLALVLAIFGVLPVHELVHAAFIRGIGHTPRLGFKWDKGVLYATADQALFTRNQYVTVALSPLVVISAAGALGLLVLPLGWWWTVALAVIFNAGGAIGDLWVSAQVVKAPRSALVRDTEDGYILYEQLDPTR